MSGFSRTVSFLTVPTLECYPSDRHSSGGCVHCGLMVAGSPWFHYS